MKALVTGATGFIGSNLVEHLIHEGHAVRCLVRSSNTHWLAGLPVEFVHGDLFDHDALRNAVAGIDYVFHSAGITKAKKKETYFRGNVTGTRNLLDAVRQHNPTIRRFLHVSSQTAVGPSPGETPIDEEAAPHPITTYGTSKWMAEEECRKAMPSLPITIVRPPAVYGPRDRDIFEFFNTMNKGLQPMVGFREKSVSLIHVADLVRGFVLAAQSSAATGQTYFLSGKGVYGWKEIGDIARRVLNRRALRIRIPEAGVYVIAGFAELLALFSRRPALVNFEKARDMVQDYWTCDASKARRDFGFEERLTLEEGIRNTIQWYRAQGWL